MTTAQTAQERRTALGQNRTSTELAETLRKAESNRRERKGARDSARKERKQRKIARKRNKTAHDSAG